MTRKLHRSLAALMAAISLAPAAEAANVAQVNLRQDAPTEIAGVGVVCTGIADSKDDPRWQTYPLRIEFANEAREHLIGAHVKLSDETGALLMNVSCWGAWLLLKPPDRRNYRIEATIIGEDAPARSATIRAPESGQTRIVLEFPGIDA